MNARIGHRSTAATLGALVALALGTITSVGPVAAGPCVPGGRYVAAIDVDGDGVPDSMYGAPLVTEDEFDDEDSPTYTQSGQVRVLGSCGLGGFYSPVESLPQDLHQSGTRLGAVVKAIDVDRDGLTDSVVSAPGARGGRGALFVFFANPTGAPKPPIELTPSVLHAGDQFGSSFDVAAARGRIEFIVGAPGTDVGTGKSRKVDAGVVYRISLQHTGSTQFVSRETWRLGHGLIPGSEHKGDRFGEVVEANAESMNGNNNTQVFLGVPRYGDYDGAKSKKQSGGAVVALNLYTHKSKLITQDTKGVPGVGEPKDRFGAAIDVSYSGVLVIGAPYENVGKKVDAGSVTVLRITSVYGVPTGGYTGGRLFTQDTKGITGTAEKGDHFGAAVVAGVYARQRTARMFAVGAPAEDVGKIKDAGSVTVVGLQTCSPVHTSCNHELSQNSPGVAGSAVSGGAFGATIARGNIDMNRILGDDTLIVGAPGTGKNRAGAYLDLDLRSAHATVRISGSEYHGGSHLGGVPFVANNSEQLWPPS